MPWRLSRMNTGKRPGSNGAGIARLEPGHHLAGDAKRRWQIGHQLPAATARRRRWLCALRSRRRWWSMRTPWPCGSIAVDADAGPDLRACVLRASASIASMAGLGRDEAAVGLEHADIIVREYGTPETAASVSAASRTRAAGRASREAASVPLTSCAVRRADLDDAGDAHQLAAAVGFQLAPQLVAPPQQRHIGRMLEIAEPDDAASRRARSRGRGPA